MIEVAPGESAGVLDGLDLHNDNVFDQEIDAVADFDTDFVASSVSP